MTKFGRNRKAIAISALAVLMTGTLMSSQLLPLFESRDGASNALAAETPTISELKGVKTDVTSIFDTNVVQKLPEALDGSREISVIVKTTDDDLTLLAAYEAQIGVTKYDSVADFAASSRGVEVRARIDRNNASAKTLIEKTGVKFKYGAEYNVLTGGFEITLTAKDYFTVKNALAAGGFTAYISEEYEAAEAQLVENDVNVYETGIFKRPDGFEYDGSGMVVAVLDTGLDYTHSVFDPALFTSDTLTMTTSSIASKISNLRAAEYTTGLSAADVYLNAKVPYAYDYADHDTDVYPLNSEHGTHVSGIILGNNVGSSLNKEGDPEIIGVAPNAQLAAMKVFSDTTSGAKQSWILSALEDCVTLGVDVINMSLGSSCGFTDAGDDEQDRVYNAVAEHGISLVAAASNDYNSTFGSEKNGNLGLTTNPDSATVGSPGTYSSSLAVASISGVKTPYLTYNGQIMYFTESSDASSEPRDFVNDILPAGVDEMDFEYVTVPGVGQSGDYGGLDVSGKIALIRRGNNTFEEKARIAQSKGAAGVIIYNNVSGDISMTVGTVKAAVCSISQDNGEMLAAKGSGVIHVSRSQVAGPFMSNFSSWGPTPDLRIKPEITAHGGDILSSVPGQAYDRLSGTSMAAPNQAGITALVRQYVSENVLPNGSATEIMAAVNQIMMSTTDIAYNMINLPYAVRKQGAGLANLTKATTTPAYITTFARSDEAVAAKETDRFTDEIMDKAKIEYGDDKEKKGIYEMKFNINNISANSVSYDVGAIVMTEGISNTKTVRGDQTVSEEGYLLDGAKITVERINGTNAASSGNVVTVAGNSTATVVVRIELSDSDKAYLEQRNTAGNLVFANGMYVEGYITLTAADGNTVQVDLNVPFLAYYGDWTQAPIFDIDYFETDPDERNNAIDQDKKKMADAVATTPIGGLYDDYINYLGSYAYIQEPGKTEVAADRNHIALTNQSGSGGGANYIYGVYAGMLRGAGRIEMTITDSSTGEVIWTKTELNQRKAYNYSGAIRASFVDVDFHVADYDLKNNTKYIFRMEAFMDYPGEQNNLNDTFEFEFTTDFQAPILTDADFRVEYDKDTKQNRLYAKLYVYDNHYPMALQTGRVYTNPDDGGIYLETFTQYPTPIIASRANATTEIEIEITDYVERMKSSYRSNTFVVELHDYAMNTGFYEINIPDSIRALYFNEMKNEDGTTKSVDLGQYGLTLSPNQTYVLEPVLYPATEWRETLNYTSSDENVLRIIGEKILAVNPGTATVTATSSTDPNVRATLTVKVLGENEEGYVRYTEPVVNNFRLTGYLTDYAFYYMGSSQRDISVTGARTLFSANASTYSVSMFPSEKITLEYELSAYFPEKTKVVFTSNDPSIVRVDEFGQVVAIKEGISAISVNVVTVNEDGTTNNTLYSRALNVTVKNPYERSGPYLMRYTGGGMDTRYVDGVAYENAVDISVDFGFTQIYQFAFSGYQYVAKDLSAGDEITEEDPSNTKIWYYGDNPDVEYVFIPEGVEVIGMYAFAGMQSLKEVWLPSTLTKIDAYAFYDCPNLVNVHGLEYVKFVNYSAFSGPTKDLDGNDLGGYRAAPLYDLSEDALASVIGIGDSAFQGTHIMSINLPKSAQSIGQYAFADTDLFTIDIAADKIKLGAGAFAGCVNLRRIKVNASVIPDGVFEGDKVLATVELGADVESIGVNAFSGTNVSNFTVAAGNKYFRQQSGSRNYPYLLSADGTTLVYVAPVIAGNKFELSGVTTIAAGAFSGNENLLEVNMPDVTAVGDYAFFACTSLDKVKFASLESIGKYAFTGTAIYDLPALSDKLDYIGDYAFAMTKLITVEIGDNVTIGEGAFYRLTVLRSVKLGNNVTVGAGAFQGYLTYVQMGPYDVGSSLYYGYYVGYETNGRLKTVEIGDNADIGPMAFSYQTKIEELTLGSGARIGDAAFYTSGAFTNVTKVDVDLSEAVSIGTAAFSGDPIYLYAVSATDGSIAGIIQVGGYQTMYIESVDLSSVTELGAQAFGYNVYVSEVTALNDSITSIPALAFAYSRLSDYSAFANVTEIGMGAFVAANFTDLDLHNVDFIGASAFQANEYLYAVELKNGVVLGNQAFYGDSSLYDVVNLDKAVYIGAYAFAETALSGYIDLSSAISIGDYAFMNTAISEVSLSENLLSAKEAEKYEYFPKNERGELDLVLGENPFIGCYSLAPFFRSVDEEFNGMTVNRYNVYTYDIGDSVKIIDGVLYKVAPNGGLVLVCYPTDNDTREFEVANGTVRISSYAFAGARLFSVVLPDTLKAIGDRAFIDCDYLSVVTFKSLNAPILEEQYDESWTYYLVTDYEGNDLYPNIGLVYDNAGNLIPSLALVPFATWNNTEVMYLYGANFKGHIGAIAGDIVMVRPSNGIGYDSFIYAQYFSQQLSGAPAADEITLAAIAAIKLIPDNSTEISEDVERYAPIIYRARELYDLIATEEQRSLVAGNYDGVNYYAKLTSAENLLEYILGTGGDDGKTDVTPIIVNENMGAVIALGVLTGVFALTTIVLFAACLVCVVVLFAKGSKGKKAAKKERNSNTQNTDE